MYPELKSICFGNIYKKKQFYNEINIRDIVEHVFKFITFCDHVIKKKLYNRKMKIWLVWVNAAQFLSAFPSFYYEYITHKLIPETMTMSF